MIELLVILAITLITIPGIYGFITGIGYFPVLPAALEELDVYFSIPEGSVVYDCGTGTGRLLFHLIGKKKNSRGIGFELFWPVYLIAKIRSLVFPHVHIRFANFYTASYSDATHIVCFLHTTPLTRLRDIWEQTLQPGTLIASPMFRIPGWEAKEIHAERAHKHVFFYRF